MYAWQVLYCCMICLVKPFSSETNEDVNSIFSPFRPTKLKGNKGEWIKLRMKWIELRLWSYFYSFTGNSYILKCNGIHRDTIFLITNRSSPNIIFCQGLEKQWGFDEFDSCSSSLSRVFRKTFLRCFEFRGFLNFRLPTFQKSRQTKAGNQVFRVQFEIWILQIILVKN